MAIVPRARRTAALAALFVLAAGCGGGKPALTPVHGKVYYLGKPVASGTVVFAPDDSRGQGGSLARGDIQSDGSYSLQSDGSYGVAAGWYRVTLMAVEMPKRPEAGERYVVPRSLVPERYRDPELAGLVREVVAGRENRIDLHLE